MRTTISILLPLCVSLGACAGASRESTTSDVRRIVDARLGQRVAWSRGDGDPAAVDPRVRELLARPLDADAAVEIALLNNSALRADLAELGVARGRLASAGRLANPDAHAAVLFPEGDEEVELDFEATIRLTSLWLLPARTGAARDELEAAKLDAAGRALALAYEARSAFYAWQAAEQQLELARTIAEAALAAYEAALRMQEAGNVTELAVLSERALYEDARLAVRSAEDGEVQARERLNTTLGVFGEHTAWRGEGRLADPEGEEPPLERLETRAIEASLDLAALRRRIDAASRNVGLARASGAIPELRAGAAAEREEGLWEVGPVVEVELPLFDQNAGESIAAQASLDALRQRFAGTAVRIRAAVRAARSRLLASRDRAIHYRDVVLPLRQRIVDQSLLHYNAMQLDVRSLLAAKREQIAAAMRYISALRDYWTARAELAAIASGRLVAPDRSSGESAPIGEAFGRGTEPVESH